MADIDIVPKHPSRTWLWIVLAIIIVAIVWIALASGRGGTNQVGRLIDRVPAHSGAGPLPG